MLKDQLLKYEAIMYCSTWLWFCFSLVPNVMAEVLKTVLGMAEEVTNSYINDILVDASIVAAGEIVDHLK